MKSLATLTVGQTARIVSIEGNDTLTVRLLEMGLTPGEQVAMLGVAPLGDPIEFSIRDYRITLRANEAGRILIDDIQNLTPA